MNLRLAFEILKGMKNRLWQCFKISAVQHVDYIRHEGNFDEDKQRQLNNKFVGNLILSAEVKNAYKNFNSLLYKTDNFYSNDFNKKSNSNSDFW